MKIGIYRYKDISLIQSILKIWISTSTKYSCIYIYIYIIMLLGLEQDPRLQQKTTGPGFCEPFIFLLDEIPKNPPAEATT